MTCRKAMIEVCVFFCIPIALVAILAIPIGVTPPCRARADVDRLALHRTESPTVAGPTLPLAFGPWERPFALRS